MCGICGVVGTGIVKDHRDIFGQLLMASSLRGINSTGVAVLAHNKIEIKKDAVSPSTFLEREWNDPYQGILDQFHTDMMMGHARLATVGKVNKENAHPFETAKYVGAHNGTLIDHRFHSNQLTDSQNLFNEMNDNGICETLKAILPSSAYALSIYDKVTGKLWLGRDAKGSRPLYLAQDKLEKVLYWASEIDMLSWILRRNQVDADYKVLTPGLMYEIELRAIEPSNKTPWVTHDVPPKDVDYRPFMAKEARKGDENAVEIECSSCQKKLSKQQAAQGYNWVSEGHRLCICEPCMNADTGRKEVA